MIHGLTCQQTTLSPPPPSSLSHQSLPLSPFQRLAQSHVCGGCPQAIHPAPLPSAGRRRRPRRAGGGPVGASEGLSGSPVEVLAQGATSAGHSESSSSRVWGPGQRDRRWCAGVTGGGTALEVCRMGPEETALGTLDERRDTIQLRNPVKTNETLLIYGKHPPITHPFPVFA